MPDWLLWFLASVALLVTEGIAFAVSSVASMAGLRPRLMHYFQLGPSSDLRTGVDALLCKTAIVTERIGPGATGRVKVDGEDWRGASSDATVIEPGTPVTIIQVDGTTLLVEKEI